MSMCYNGETKECDDMQEMIKLENVTKVYKTGVRAVNDMSLTIDAGEFVYVIGPTGAGKSTFIKLNYRLLPKKTVFENVAFALEVTNTPKTEIRKKVRNVLELVGLENKANSFPHELSGGQQQRVAIARAIVNQPKVLIADEPTGNLDPETSQGIIELLERINDVRQTTVLVVTHDREIVQRNKKRTILIEDGCVTTDTSLGGYQSWNS